MDSPTSTLRKPLRKRWSFWFLIIVALYACIGFLVVPLIVKKVVIDFVQETFGRKVEIGSLRTNPFTFSGTAGDFVLYETGTDTFMTVDEVFVDISILPLLNHRIDITEVDVNRPSLALEMREDSTFNVDDLVNYVLTLRKSDKPWDVIVERVMVHDLAVSLSDQTTNPPADLQVDSTDATFLGFHARSSDTTHFSVSCMFVHGGRAQVQGIYIPVDVLADAEVHVEEMALVPLQPYLSRYAHLEITAGGLNADGNVHAAAGDSSSPELSFIGNVGVAQLNLNDKLKNERILGWDLLSMNDMEARVAPIKVRAEEIRIKNVYTRFEIAADKSLNVKDVLAPTLAKMDTNMKVQTMPDVYVGRVVLEDGEADFADYSLPLPFGTHIHSLKGEITEIVPNSPTGASVTARGAIDEYGLAKAEGGFDPFAPLRYTDLNVVLTNIEMTRLTPYSAQFAGYKIDKGRMSLDLEYKIRNGQLLGQNKVLLEKLTLGEEIESKEATSLPVKLAIALLKDSHGNIDLDMEVEGDLNNPEVNMGKLVLQAFTKVLVNVVTAPFKFLGSLFGVGGEEMEFIQFEPGMAELTLPQYERLDNLSKALGDRPSLKLGIHGTYDLATDAHAIRKRKFEEVLRAKMTELSTTGADSLSPTDASKLLRKSLEHLYVEEYSAQDLSMLQSQNATVTDTTAPTLDIRAYLDAVRAALIEKQPLEEEELPALADARADSIRTHLIVVGKIPDQRLAILERKELNNEDDKWVRCQLTLDAMEDVVGHATASTDSMKRQP